MEPTSSATENDVVWELRRDDDGFVYKRNRTKKRRLDVDGGDDAPPPPSSAADEEAEARRREWREKALLKLKVQYQAEIEQWELLTTRLKAMEEKTSLIRRRRLEQSERDQTASFGGNGVAGNGSSESALDELLLQAEAQESIIADVSCLCDMVEAMCRAEEDDVAQSLIDLPIWGSPRELMRSLCDE
ncbi:uncharacterized protein LOC126799897 [Argentina anserina]|uniref:uncharacterized protein LOC126799897 n=1 Tax=Argentina anserina TaxID=57926 RepID=UPI00217635F7|nr:uncharacterized protein LOC126799897 [Potentilla anserina]